MFISTWSYTRFFDIEIPENQCLIWRFCKCPFLHHCWLRAMDLSIMTSVTPVAEPRVLSCTRLGYRMASYVLLSQDQFDFSSIPCELIKIIYLLYIFWHPFVLHNVFLYLITKQKKYLIWRFYQMPYRRSLLVNRDGLVDYDLCYSGRSI